MSNPSSSASAFDNVNLFYRSSTCDPDTFHRFSAFIDRCLAAPVVAIDLETSGLHPWGHNADKIRLISFGIADEAWAVSDISAGLAAYWYLVQRGARITNWNSKFDEAFLKAETLRLHRVTGGPLTLSEPWHDAMIAHHLLHSNEAHGLKGVAAKAYGREVRAGEKALHQLMKANKWDWGTVPVDHPLYWGYGAFDTVLAARLSVDLIPPARAEYGPAYDRERRAARLLSNIEEKGIRIDMEYTAELVEQWSSERDELTNLIHSAAKIDNPGSSMQLAAFLEDQGWEPDEFTDTGKPRTNKAVLNRLQAAGFQNDTLTMVLRHRRITKWISSYLRPFLESGGRVHPNIRPMGAKTGRQSVNDPPLQQLPKGESIRRSLLPEEGEELWTADYKGQEARFGALLSGDPRLIEMFMSGKDPHKIVASAAFDMPVDEVTDKERDPSKNTFFAGLYGAGDPKIAATAGVEIEVVAAIRSAIAREFPGMGDLMDRVCDVVRRRAKEEGDGRFGYVMTYGGRKLMVDKGEAYKGLNYSIQGGAADMMKDGLIRVDDAGLASNVMLLVHDECVISTPNPEDADAIACLMKETVGPMTFDVDLKGPASNWGALKIR